MLTLFAFFELFRTFSGIFNLMSENQRIQEATVGYFQENATLSSFRAILDKKDPE